MQIQALLLLLQLVTLSSSSFFSDSDSRSPRWEFLDGDGFDGYWLDHTTKRFRNRFKLHPFAKLDTPQLAAFRGYTAEVHRLVTQDGFVLELHRIPNGRTTGTYGLLPVTATRNLTARPPVLIQHGNFQSSVDWLLNEKDDNCLPLLLADTGYDVWLGNFRGNVYSSKHVKYKKTDPRYWNFSAHEIAVYDLSAMIDYILWTTNHRQLHYVGFSLGTTAFFMLLAHSPAYNAKIRLGVSLGTAVYQHHSRMLKTSCAWISFLEAAVQIAGHFPIPPPFLARAIRRYIPHLCNHRTFTLIPNICWLMWSFSWGFDGLQITKPKISLLLSKIPHSSSSKTAIHICHVVNRKAFTYYDYGRKKNLRRYGSAVPPKYNLSAVTAPISLFYAPKDLVAVLEDVDLLAHRLPNLVDLHHVPYSRFNHIDFVFAKHARELVYQHVLDKMARF